MTVTAHVYQIYINADADLVWAGITESEWKKKYFHGTSYVEGPVAGARFRTITADGRDAIDGVVEEMTPPAPGRPGRFVQTWHVLYNAAMAEEPPSRVEWTVEQVGERLTRVRLVHGDLAGSPLTWANVKDGWVWVLDALKTVLETGRTLPGVDDGYDTPRRTPPTATGTVARASRPTTRSIPCSTQPETLPRTRSCSGWRTPRRTTGSARPAAPPPTTPARRT